MQTPPLPTSLLKGALAGAVATAPMTVAMFAMHKALPAREKAPLPPSQITATLERKAHIAHRIDDEQHKKLTLANHFAYGALCGAVFCAADARALRSTVEAVRAGVACGLTVWATSYLGWLPALHVHPGATKMTVRRNALMIAAHIAWGAALGLVARALVARR